MAWTLAQLLYKYSNIPSRHSLLSTLHDYTREQPSSLYTSLVLNQQREEEQEKPVDMMHRVFGEARYVICLMTVRLNFFLQQLQYIPQPAVVPVARARIEIWSWCGGPLILRGFQEKGGASGDGRRRAVVVCGGQQRKVRSRKHQTHTILWCSCMLVWGITSQPRNWTAIYHLVQKLCCYLLNYKISPGCYIRFQHCWF